MEENNEQKTEEVNELKNNIVENEKQEFEIENKETNKTTNEVQKSQRNVISTSATIPQLITFAVAMALFLVLIPIGIFIYIIVKWCTVGGTIPNLILTILGFGVFVAIGIYFCYCMIRHIIDMKKQQK